MITAGSGSASGAHDLHAPRELDEESRRWVDGLRPDSADHNETIARLHAKLARMALAETNRRAPRLNLYGPELDDIATQAASDALLAVTAKVDQFRGESKFTTWAYKFVIFEVAGKMSRHFWSKSTVAYDAEDWAELPARLGAGPEAEAEGRDLSTAVRRAVQEELTESQRVVFVALVLNGMPLDALVAELGSTRNAIYKMMFDARRKVRASLVANGYLAETDAHVAAGEAS